MPKILPNELILEVNNFTKFNRKWTNCRVSFAFDKFLLEKMGAWLIQMKKMAALCAQSIDELCITINSVADDQAKLAAATGAYNGLKKFIDQLPNLPSPPALADLSLDEEEDYAVSVLNKCSDLVRMCCQFHRSSAAALGRLNDYITGFKDAYAMV